MKERKEEVRRQTQNKNGKGETLEYSCVQSSSPRKASESHKSHEGEKDLREHFPSREL